MQRNKVAMKYIKEEEEDADPIRNLYVSHILSNRGKKVLRVLGASVKHIEEVCEKWQVAINNPRKARDKATKRFDACAITSGGIYFFNKLE